MMNEYKIEGVDNFCEYEECMFINFPHSHNSDGTVSFSLMTTKEIQYHCAQGKHPELSVKDVLLIPQGGYFCLKCLRELCGVECPIN